MMDFDNAAARLARDQSKMRGRRRGGLAISARAAKQAEYQKKQQARLRAEREQKKRKEAHRQQCLHECRRLWKEKPLAGGSSSSSSSSSSSLLLTPTSIHGNGDKIALPPSVLETLTSQSLTSSMEDGNPWTFRIGVLNPSYEFPASPSFRNLAAPTEIDDEDDDDMSDEDDENDDEEEKSRLYLDELDHKYLSYTHCTVVEFTQEEGHVGIPRHVARALLDPSNRRSGAEIPSTTTVDPAASRADADADAEGNDEAMGVDDGTEQTPGHLAWGAFEIPEAQLEITMVKLPKGTGCTLVPTEEAVRSNFYGLKDVKLVLEQSLIRTRATLSRGDKVSTWHRGTEYLLTVSKVIPSSFHAVTCINTDIEVEIGETNAKPDQPQADPSPAEKEPAESGATNHAGSGFRLGTGQSLASPPQQQRRVDSPQPGETIVAAAALLAEPPIEQKDGVCVVQIRFSGGHGKRRFAIGTARTKDLFAFAASLVHRNERTFRLVTRFPRREFSLAGNGADDDSAMDDGSGNHARPLAELTLEQAGIQQGQEMFMVEDL